VLLKACVTGYIYSTMSGRRFATFKVFYTEETPIEYEPPHFEPGDAEKDKWFFMTHDLDEVPERTSIGKIDTGHHS
jgi:meiosis-specific protein HOP1